mgnify:CR=1 FL=1
MSGIMGLFGLENRMARASVSSLGLTRLSFAMVLPSASRITKPQTRRNFW